MKDILIKLKWLDDTLTFCGVDIDNSSADLVKGILYEDFNVSVHTFFHPSNLEPLLDARLISGGLVTLCLQIREIVVALTEAQAVAGDVRKNQQWSSVIAMCEQGQRMRQKIG